MKAVYPATQVNLDSSQFADYSLMVQRGWSKLYRGTARYAGNTAYDDPQSEQRSGESSVRGASADGAFHVRLGRPRQPCQLRQSGLRPGGPG